MTGSNTSEDVEFDELFYWLSLCYSKKTPESLAKLPIGVASFPLKQLHADKMKEIFDKNIRIFSIYKLCSIIKKALKDYLKVNKIINASEDPEFKPLIKSFSKFLIASNQPNLDYAPRFIESLRIIRNCFEYSEGIVCAEDIRKAGQTGNQLCIEYPTFITFATDQNGNEVLIASGNNTLPKNSALEFRKTFEKKIYQVGEKIEPLSVETLICAAILLRALFFNKGIDLEISYFIINT